MAKRNRPVFLCGMMGGNVLALIKHLRGDAKIGPEAFGGDPKRTVKLLKPFQKEKITHLAETAGLTDRDQSSLFEAENLDTIIELTAQGLLNLRKS